MSISHSVRKAAEFIGGQRGVDHVYVIGSAQFGCTDQYSDIDLLAVCRMVPTASARLRHYRLRVPAPQRFHTFNLKSWEFGTSDSFIFDTAPLCIMYYTAEQLAQKIEDVTQGDGESHGFYLPTGFLCALSGARLIESASAKADCPLFVQLSAIAQPLLQRVTRRSRIKLTYFLEASKVGLLRGDYFFTQQCLFHLREAVFSLTFATARRYRVSDKRMAAELSQCESKVPASLMTLARKMLALSDFAPDAMRDIVEQLAPLVLSLEEIQWR